MRRAVSITVGNPDMIGLNLSCMSQTNRADFAGMRRPILSEDIFDRCLVRLLRFDTRLRGSAVVWSTVWVPALTDHGVGAPAGAPVCWVVLTVQRIEKDESRDIATPTTVELPAPQTHTAQPACLLVLALHVQDASSN